MFAGADVDSGRILTSLTVTGLDFANDTANTILSKIAAAIRAVTPQYANGSGGAGFTILRSSWLALHGWLAARNSRTATR